MNVNERVELLERLLNDINSPLNRADALTHFECLKRELLRGVGDESCESYIEEDETFFHSVNGGINISPLTLMVDLNSQKGQFINKLITDRHKISSFLLDISQIWRKIKYTSDDWSEEKIQGWNLAMKYINEVFEKNQINVEDYDY